ncbi:hypothetical protein [Methylophaga sp.]|uniref:hypothetical protein n=1 Tax=Methylophaga sp. TaxID=2024840 RepID=UPI003A8CD35C
MTDKRPKQLVREIKARMDNNDSLLSTALDTFEKQVLAGKVKPTMNNLRKLCRLSEGSIRNRRWALNKFESIKFAAKTKKKNLVQERKNENEVQRLNIKVKDLLVENALLFEEIIGLQEQIKRRVREIEVLKRRLEIKSNN